jgi:hypothetical protein
MQNVDPITRAHLDRRAQLLEAIANDPRLERRLQLVDFINSRGQQWPINKSK